MNDEIFLESMSHPGTFYKISLSELTCTCKYFTVKLERYSLDNPRRLCKHLILILAKNGIPETLQAFKEDIMQRASQGQSYIAAKYQSQGEKLPLAEGSIETITAKKKIKYAYLTGTVDGRSINANIDLSNGEVSLQIFNYWASCSLAKMKCALPEKYIYMEAALLKWLSDEYNKLE